MPSSPAAVILIWFVLPLWLLAGVAVVPYIEELVRCLRSHQHVRAAALVVQQR